MKTKSFLFKSLIVVAAAGMMLTSCRKDKDEDNDTVGAADNALAESSYNDVANMAQEVNNITSGSKMTSFKTDGTDGVLAGSCATVYKYNKDTTNADTIIIDFGSSNCVCVDGRSRRGKIIIKYSGTYLKAGSTANISFDNYFVNDNSILGTKSIVNNGKNSSGNTSWTVTVNGHIIKADGKEITWTTTKTREIIAGESTPNIISDDVYSVTGNSNGSNSDGKSYTATVTSALIRDMSCPKHFVKGVLEVTPNGKKTRIIDFGNGACDNTATVTIGKNTYTITLK